jgi:predicted CoA-binding protein
MKIHIVQLVAGGQILGVFTKREDAVKYVEDAHHGGVSCFWVDAEIDTKCTVLIKVGEWSPLA